MTKWKLPPEGGQMDKPSGRYFQNMTYKEINERVQKDDILIIPVGSTEAHGKNACPGEDTFLVARMAELVAQRTGCTVAQPVWYGAHPYHHLGMPGNIIIPDETLSAYLRGIIAGFWNAGFRKQILLNGHGQHYVIASAIHEFAKRYQVPGIFISLNWPDAVPAHFRTKEEGGKYETYFIHADEVETSWSLALLPEFIKQEEAVDTKPIRYLPDGHIDISSNLLRRPINWSGSVGCYPITVIAYPEGIVGKPTLASADKAKPGIKGLLDYIAKLHDDILKKFPPGKLPPIQEVTQRPKEEIIAVVKGPLKGGRHIYTIAYPP